VTVYGYSYPHSVLSLARYAELIGYQDCSFFGFSHPDRTSYACTEIWTNQQRNEILRTLQDAQLELEREIGYHIESKWIVAEKHPFRKVITLDKGYLIALGIKAEETIASNISLNMGASLTDPAQRVIPTILTSTDGITIYYPGTTHEITPSSLAISGGNLTVIIPKCRLPKYSLIENTASGISWDAANIQSSIDVKRVYNDPTVHASLIWNHICNVRCASTLCSEYTVSACGMVRDNILGTVEFFPAEYVSGAWKSTNGSKTCVGTPEWIKINYVSGLQGIDLHVESTLLRLAHSKLPNEPCGCDISQRMWARDRNIPKLLTRDRLECPFGMSDGAWTAWKFAETIKLYRASVIA